MTDKMTDKKSKTEYKRIIEFLDRNEFITNMIARELLELTDITAKRLLKKMVEDGILVAVGEKKSRKYIMSK